MIRVLLADDQALVRDGFRMIVDAQADMEVVGEAGNGIEALALARELGPDVVLMDIRMPELDGLEATRRLLARPGEQPKVIMLTTFDEDANIYEALLAGASGFMLKDLRREQLLHALRAVVSGEEILAPTVTRRLIERYVGAPPSRAAASLELAALSERELEVLRLVAEGLTNNEIAERLVVSSATVKTHVAHVLQKLGVRDRIRAVIFAYESGLVAPAS